MMHGLMPLKASAFVRYQADGASGGATPPADTKPDDATGSDKAGGKTFTQAELDAIVEKRLSREREAQERKATEAQKAAEIERLEKDRKFEELANARKAEIDTLAAKAKDGETAQTQLARATTALEAYRDAQFGKLPEEIAELLSGKDIVDQLDWLTKNGAKFVAPNAAGASPAKKGGGTPAPVKGKPVSGELTAADLIARKRAQLGLA